MSNFDFLTVFRNFLASHPDKSDIIGLTETTGCLKPPFKTGYAQFA